MLNRVFGFFSADLAIDLGTANTLISVPGEGLVLNEPSVVAVGGQSRRVVSGGCAVGHLARQMWGRTPDSISVVRPLKDGVITDFQLCEAMLRYFLRKVQRNRWSPRPRVLIGVPGSITPVEKRAVFNSAQRAGAREVLLIAEAKAAAIGVGLPIAEPLASMIVDIGGGTSEIAVLSVGDVVSSRSLRMGGDHMDQAVADYLRRRYGLRIGLAAAEQLRIAIGSAYPLEEELVEEVAGADTASGLPRRLTISSEELREALAEPLEAIVDAIQQTVDGCSPDLAADLIHHGLVLCGGGALLRGLDRFLGERTGIPARVAPDALGAVAKGILTCLEHLDIWRGTLESSDDDV
jgi:rod shape-determining protein MreB and related proteins